VTLEADISCLHRRNLRPTRQAGNRSPVNVTIPNLTLKEFSLIDCLARTPGRVFERSHLIDKCYPGDGPLDRTIDSHMCNLRSKLETAGVSCMLVTIRGVRYRLENSDG